ncbi:hypothetical protein [Cloacibacillus sp.]|uniref:hypothetical protein n=1 Tax=Cloacibacillus sp. TaxID=2049023 RepID=UPI0025C0DF51|nr:hypothetical protein [Cloacibacillus sp.]
MGKEINGDLSLFSHAGLDPESSGMGFCVFALRDAGDAEAGVAHVFVCIGGFLARFLLPVWKSVLCADFPRI